MGVDYTIDTASRTVALVYDSAGATLEDWQRAIERVLQDPRYERRFGVITDRRLAPLPPTTDGIRSAVDYVASREELRGTRWALVVTGSASYGMMRMGQILGEAKDIEIRVFDSVEMARRWLERHGAAGASQGNGA